MKAKIRSADLKTFFSYASKIKTSAIIPILEFIKVEFKGDTVSFSKSNLNSYITYSAKFINEEIPAKVVPAAGAAYQIDLEDSIAEIKGVTTSIFTLIEERILLAAIAIDKEFIEIEITNSFVKVNTVRSVIQDGLFPSISGMPTAEAIVFDKEILDAINCAKEYIYTEGGENNFSFIHLAHNMIFASMSSIMYLKKFDSLPSALLSYECATIISKFDSLSFYEIGNYNIFSNENIILGFIKSTYTTPDFLRLLDKCNIADKLFLIKRTDLVSYCNLTIASSKQLPNSIFTISHPNSTQIECEYKDEKIENRAQINCKYLKEPSSIPATSFQPSVMAQAISSLPFEDIELSSPQDGMYIVRTPEDLAFTSIIMGMRKN